MKIKLLITTLVCSALFVLWWILQHHMYMYKEARVVEWVTSLAMYSLFPWVVTIVIGVTAWGIGSLILRKDPVIQTAVGLGIIGAVVWSFLII